MERERGESACIIASSSTGQVGGEREHHLITFPSAALMGPLRPLTDTVKEFARIRPPGIYKHDYLDLLYRYFHEKRPSAVATPAVPPWKATDVRWDGKYHPDDVGC